VKYFIAIEEDLLLKLWMLDPQLVTPLSRRELQVEHQTLRLEVKALGLESKASGADSNMREPDLKTSGHQSRLKKAR